MSTLSVSLAEKKPFRFLISSLRKFRFRFETPLTEISQSIDCSRFQAKKRMPCSSLGEVGVPDH